MKSQIAECVAILESLSAHHALSGVKAEYEAEGTRSEELRWLRNAARKAKVSLTLKIGGSSAVRDLIDARAVGVDKIVCPMIESEESLSRFVENAFSVYTKNDIPKLYINMETITCAQSFDKIMNASSAKHISGIVVGRSDLTGSMGLAGVDVVNSDDVFFITRKVAETAKDKGLAVVVGGKITVKSIPFLSRLIEESLLDSFETRKAVFTASEALSIGVGEGIRGALGFELAWMKLKRRYYAAIASEDEERINDLEKRIVL